MRSCLVPAKALIRHLSAELTEPGYQVHEFFYSFNAYWIQPAAATGCAVKAVKVKSDGK